MKHPLIYIILNGSLKMSSGKAAAQTAHAMIQLSVPHGLRSAHVKQRTVIVLEARDQEQMQNIKSYLKGVADCAVYIDEGVNEVGPFAMTAMAIGPVEREDWDTRELLSGLPLYGKKSRRLFG